MSKTPRTLKSAKLRAALWIAANGKCQRCGRDLPEVWHADHIMPFSVSQRTNVHEMQALCPDCNLKKAAKVPQQNNSIIGVASMDRSKLREGQRVAIDTAIERIRTGERFTAIVLPTRYGKSDTIRLIAIEARRLGLSTVSLALSPNEVLRDQLVEKTIKVPEMCRRYNITDYIRMCHLPKFQMNFHVNGDVLISTTVQLVQQNANLFSAWVDSVTHSTGKPPIIHVDEGHCQSELNLWGKAVQQLAEAGAHVILYTATPVRHDGQQIPGFKYVVQDFETYIVNKYRRSTEGDKVIREVWERRKEVVELQADVEVKFSQAWDEGTLCKVSRVPFEVETENSTPLSMLPETKVREVLGRVVRDPIVIREGARRLVEQLRKVRRGNFSVPNAAAIVFCGNDTDSEKRANEHARQIRDAIECEDSSLRCVIATIADGNAEAKERIQRFASESLNDGDVLIVKQMAGVGLDVGRIKVVLDLSPNRSLSAVVQRWMRAATPYMGIMVCTIIHPDEVLSRRIFIDVVENQGGAVTRRDLNKISEELVDPESKEKEDWLFSVMATSDANFDDNRLNRAHRDLYPRVQLWLEELPFLSNFLTHAELAQKIERLDSLDTPQAEIVDTQQQISELRESINVIAKDICQRRLRPLVTTHEDGTETIPPGVYQEYIRKVYADIYLKANIYKEYLRLSEIADLSVLRQIKVAAETIREREGGRFAT